MKKEIKKQKKATKVALGECDLSGYEVLVLEGGRTVHNYSAGNHRQDSVRNGLAEVTCDVVAIHDAARPMVTREIIEESAVELGHVHFAWHIPEVRHADVPVLDVLSVLLGSGRSSARGFLPRTSVNDSRR